MKTELTTEDKILIVEFSKYLDRFKTSALKKFVKGRLEHDEDVLTINCEKEIMQEQMDIIAYTFIKTLQ